MSHDDERLPPQSPEGSEKQEESEEETRKSDDEHDPFDYFGVGKELVLEDTSALAPHYSRGFLRQEEDLWKEINELNSLPTTYEQKRDLASHYTSLAVA